MRSVAGFERRLFEFARVLRANGVRVSTAEDIDSLGAVAAIGLGSRVEVQSALRATLIKRTEDIGLFDRLFDLYFLGFSAFLIGAANTDEAAFPNASAVDFDREANRHIAFGAGPHRCLGSHLARMELRVGLDDRRHLVVLLEAPHLEGGGALQEIDEGEAIVCAVVLHQRPAQRREGLREHVHGLAAGRGAALLENVEGFPEAFETMLGERGITLSGGQKQRTALARALVREPQILILDDALSAVDTRTEATILEHVRQHYGRRTVVVVSHRISAVQDADLILVLEEGRIVERGKHADLVQTGGLYASLYRKQQLEEEIEAEG